MARLEACLLDVRHALLHPRAKARTSTLTVRGSRASTLDRYFPSPPHPPHPRPLQVQHFVIHVG
eukprot:267835-Prorocentrum_minimum.AAC.1